ncbi:unnamed protein product [Cylindrotheca closterium]|uniref:Uncharacterized protein n=1 Tax=Cylindrotheca closterium TaxID=2856 RepID=A0AAD2CL11_9STRA|nr:unnamed protein product [Cylindrotheca closterium]
MSKPKEEQPVIPFEPKPNDIVCTKLRTWNSKHSGNKFFNAMIQETACKVQEENIKSTSEMLLNVVVNQRGGRFLKLSDADVLHGTKPNNCTVMNRKQCLNKVIRTLRTAFCRHHGTLAKRMRPPTKTRRKKAKEYKLHSGSSTIHPYALQLLAGVMNSTKNVAYRELDKPGEPYDTIETEPHQLRLMRLQLRHRLIAAKEAMMPAVEFGIAIMNLWGGRVEVQKNPLPSVVVSNTTGGAEGASEAAGTEPAIAADNIGSLNTINTDGTGITTNTIINAASNTNPSNVNPSNVNPSNVNPNITTTSTAVMSKESSQLKNNEMKDQMRAATRNKMKNLMTDVGGGTGTKASSHSKATRKPVRGSLASKTLPRGSLASKALPNTSGDGGGANKKMSPNKATADGSPGRKKRNSPSRGSPSRASSTRAGGGGGGGGKLATPPKSTKPRRGSLASKTLPDMVMPAAVAAAAGAAAGPSKEATTIIDHPPSQHNIGSLVHNVELANEDSPFYAKL